MFQTNRVLKNQGCKCSSFSDVSETGYEQAGYMPLVSEDNQIYCSLLIGKSRMTPAKYVSIPRLELAATTLSIKMSQLIKRELKS